MTSQSPFSASTSKYAYAQAFSRTSIARPGHARSRVALRAITARLHRSAALSR